MSGKGQALGGCVSSEISPPSQAGGHVAAELPALLHRAIRRVAELDNAGEAVTMLVPDLGHNKDTRRVSRGGIQRALHGLGESGCHPSDSMRLEKVTVMPFATVTDR